MYLSKPNVSIIRDSKICHPPYHVRFYAVKPGSPTDAGLNVQPTRMCNMKPHPLNGAGLSVVPTRLLGYKQSEAIGPPILVLYDVVNCVYINSCQACTISSSRINL